MPSQYEISRDYIPVGERDVDVRASFITRTYNHLMGAIVAFTLFEVWLFTSGLAEVVVQFVAGTSWLLVLGAFILVTWLASRTAERSTSVAAQYAGLGAMVVAYGLITVPMLYIANETMPGVISSAAIVTLLGFAGLTAVAFTTRKDFSFLRGALMWGGVVAVGAILASFFYGFHLGTLFSVAMVGFAGAAILYNTSNVLHHYPADRHVAAALQLFASVALLFWYVLRIFMSRD